MDIIDVMLARALTPQGQTETYVSIANAAAAKAAKAEQDAESAIATVEAAADEIATAKEEAADLLEAAQQTLEIAQQAQLNIPDTEDIDAEVKKLNVSVNTVSGTNVNTVQVVTTYPDNTLNTQNVTKLYKSTGTNEDGTMTQKAITNTFVTKQYVDDAIASIPVGDGSNSSGSINLGANNADHLVAIDDDGNLTASIITQSTLINALLEVDAFTAQEAVGLDIDYANRTFTRIQLAAGRSMGDDFNRFTMYGGRTKCNVADDGTINAFYGDNNYIEDGSNGQVMVYQPKFYYRRNPYILEDSARGKIIRHESLMISAIEQAGFKLAPVFTGNLDYVLLPAYDGAVVDNKLSSIAGVTPINNLTIAQAETYATARGEGWHIMTLPAESANQMLEIVEFGMMNGQTALESGITANISGSSILFITGSTAALGNGIGHATSSQALVNGNTVTYTDIGKRAITYRGVENPWGHLWQMIGGINIKGTGQSNGGIPCICTDYNYTPTAIGSNYEEIGFALPSQYRWINAMGYGTAKYDWVFMPIECSNSATSLLPVGDGIWSTNGLNGINILASGGSYGYVEECGPFYYAADRAAADSARVNYGAKLLFIPTKNATYYANIEKWNTYMGG